jgi:Domain of unknown function (DUF4394)
MKRYKVASLAITSALFVGGVSLLRPAAATTASVRLIGLADNNELVMFAPDKPNRTREVTVTGIEGKLVGIDVRPANGMLYGLTSTNKLYKINLNSGVAQMVSNLSTALNGSERTGMDFNPVPDRLRLVDATGKNLRVNVETGETAVDKPLNYKMGDANVNTLPQVSAAAYTNAFAGPPSPAGVTPPSRTTQLFNIDPNRDVLVLQNPPNEGGLQTIGALGVDFAPMVGFDIASPAPGMNTAYAVSGATLYRIDLATGAATSIGTIGDGKAAFMGLAAIPKP